MPSSSPSRASSPQRAAHAPRVRRQGQQISQQAQARPGILGVAGEALGQGAVQGQQQLLQGLGLGLGLGLLGLGLGLLGLGLGLVLGLALGECRDIASSPNTSPSPTNASSPSSRPSARPRPSAVAQQQRSSEHVNGS